MRVFITRYCLTKGILELDVEFNGDGAGKCKEFPYEYFWLWDKDTYKTRESAVKRANEVLQNKIARTEKKLAKLREMSFE